MFTKMTKNYVKTYKTVLLSTYKE